MISSSERIGEILESIPANSIIEASKLYRMYFEDIKETAFYKSLERLCQKDSLVHLTKGLYYKPKVSRIGVVPIKEKDIVAHYIEELGGVVVGYKLYNKKGLTTQVGKQTEILSNRLNGQKKTIQNVVVRSIPCDLTVERVAIIETLEILQNYYKIEDINNAALANYMKNFAKKYSDKDAVYIIENMKYKKSTIAFLEAFLNHLQICNSLGMYLSSLSVYANPTMEEIYATS